VREDGEGRGSKGGESMAPGPNGGAQDQGLGRAGALQQQQERINDDARLDLKTQIRMRWAAML